MRRDLGCLSGKVTWIEECLPRSSRGGAGDFVYVSNAKAELTIPRSSVLVIQADACPPGLRQAGSQNGGEQ